MDFHECGLVGPVLVEPVRIGDERGYFAETFRLDQFLAAVGDFPFVQDNESLSAKVGTVRGLHFQSDPCAQGKLVRCTAGALFDVAVDIRADSPTFGRWVGVELSAANGRQLWVPRGFAHGFCTLLPNTVISYKVTAFYSQPTIRGWHGTIRRWASAGRTWRMPIPFRPRTGNSPYWRTCPNTSA